MTIPANNRLLGRHFDGGNIYFVYAAGGELLTVQLTDGDETALLVDDSIADERILTTIAFPHHEIHEGNHYEASYKSPEGADVGDNNSLDILFVTGNRAAHTVAITMAGGDAEVFLYEGTTTTDNGTLATQANLNRTSTNTPAATVFHTPTVSGVGTLLLNFFMPGGSGGQTVGGAASHDVEWILKQNTKHLLRITNRAGTAQPVGAVVQWYEP